MITKTDFDLDDKVTWNDIFGNRSVTLLDLQKQNHGLKPMQKANYISEGLHFGRSNNQTQRFKHFKVHRSYATL